MNDYREEPCPFPGSTLYLPVGQEVRGGVVFFPGSEGRRLGGYQDVIARYLAAQGYLVLVFASWGHRECPVPGLPPFVIGIELERSIAAITWLQAYPGMQGKKTALWGFSRGAEQVLILASTQQDPSLPRIDVIAVHAVNSHTESGYYSVGQYVYPYCFEPRAWSWQGQYWPVWQPIAIEHFPRPILLSHAVEDEIWSFERAKVLAARAKDKRSPDAVLETHYLANEKHLFSREAMFSHVENVLRFFHRHLQ